jgi:hypothetical protein
MEQSILNSITIFALKDFNCKSEIELFHFDEISFIKGWGQLDSEYFTDASIKLIGQLNLMSFADRFFAAAKKDLATLDELSNEHIRLKSKTNHFINCLWFAKDNSASIINLYTYTLNTNYCLQSVIGPGNSSAIGENNPVEFDKEDFDKALNIYNAILSVQTKIESDSPKIDFGGRPIITDSKYHKANQNKTNRIDRALSFLFIARNNSFLPLKISLYISVLECLFTKDAGDIVHKISERTAFYIGETPDERIDLYRSVKKAYSVRSKFFHGQQLEKKSSEHEALQDVSLKIDDLLRKVLNKVLLVDSTKFLSNDEQIEEFYTKLIFKTT